MTENLISWMPTNSLGMGNLTYEERLAKLGLTTLKDRRERGDVIETYRILTEEVVVNPDTWFTSIGSREGSKHQGQ